MRYRSWLSLAILVVTACSTGMDGPTAVGTGEARLDEGVKPPPPLGSGDVEITLYSPSSETPFEESFEGGPSAAFLDNQSFFAQVHGRYFSNSQFTNGWIAFVSDECVVASPDAKLQYNEKTGNTQGHGTLTDTCGGDVVLDLSKMEITSEGFGGCELKEEVYECRTIEFSYDGIPGGRVYIGTYID